MRINIVTPVFKSNTFSGGALCLLQYAHHLGLRGHEVNVVPMLVSESPDWFAKPWAFNFVTQNRRELGRRAAGSLLAFAPKLIAGLLTGSGLRSPQVKQLVRGTAGSQVALWSQYASYGATKGAAIDTLLNVLPDADATIATDFETAYAVALAGKGELFYFSQHYEALFWKERPAGPLARREAELSYGLGLRQIVNSPWLAQHLRSLGHRPDAAVCSNAIDHAVFNGEPRGRADTSVVNVISYGGRDADWKGFREMCEAVRAARAAQPGIRFNWRVYGTALIPPDNDIAPYEALGFLNPTQLADTYRKHEVLLSASWYESFPLFPIEAMACGLATICTQPGTEVYALPGITAEVVEAQNPDSIAGALVRLATDESHRFALAQAGHRKAREFTWDASVTTMEGILTSASTTAA